MQIKFKDGKPVVSLTVNERKTIDTCAGVMKELARFPEVFPTAEAASKALADFSKKAEAK
jgi:hypothetical protein